MPRITKKMKQEELKAGEERIASLIMMCLGYNVSNTDNIVDESGMRLVFGKEDNKKFLKWGDGPFRFREIKFDPVNNYQLTAQLFGQFIKSQQQEENEYEMETGDDITPQGEVRTIALMDDQMRDDGKQLKHVEVGYINGALESEQYFCPTLGYIELIFGLSGILPDNQILLRRVDELKDELEPLSETSDRGSRRSRKKTH